MRDKGLSVPLGAAGGSVAAANDGDGTILGGRHNAIHNGLGAVAEVGELKDAGGTGRKKNQIIVDVG